MRLKTESGSRCMCYSRNTVSLQTETTVGPVIGQLGPSDFESSRGVGKEESESIRLLGKWHVSCSAE